MSECFPSVVDTGEVNEGNKRTNIFPSIYFNY